MTPRIDAHRFPICPYVLYRLIMVLRDSFIFETSGTIYNVSLMIGYFPNAVTIHQGSRLIGFVLGKGSE